MQPTSSLSVKLNEHGRWLHASDFAATDIRLCFEVFEHFNPCHCCFKIVTVSSIVRPSLALRHETVPPPPPIWIFASQTRCRCYCKFIHEAGACTGTCLPAGGRRRGPILRFLPALSGLFPLDRRSDASARPSATQQVAVSRPEGRMHCFRCAGSSDLHRAAGAAAPARPALQAPTSLILVRVCGWVPSYCDETQPHTRFPQGQPLRNSRDRVGRPAVSGSSSEQGPHSRFAGVVLQYNRRH